jgi:hypothetical protein
LAAWRQIRDDLAQTGSARIEAAAKLHAYAWGKPVETTRAEVFDHREPPTITIRTLPIGRAEASEDVPAHELEETVN